MSEAPRADQLMVIVLNGSPVEVVAGSTVAELLQRTGVTGRLAVERNGHIVPRSQYADVVLAAGDHLEIVRAIGGGDGVGHSPAAAPA